MEPRKEEKQKQTAPQVRKQEPKPKLQIVKLEERIAPGTSLQHNETLVRAPAQGKPKAAEASKPKPKLQIVKLEERIAPALTANHNETLVRETVKAAKPRKEKLKPKLQIVKLEERIAPGTTLQHNVGSRNGKGRETAQGGAEAQAPDRQVGGADRAVQRELPAGSVPLG